jgi:hypothetical protein
MPLGGHVPKGDYQGWLFAYHLSSTRLWVKLCRVLPVAWVKLADIRTLRRAESAEYWGGGLGRFLRFWKTWHWPYPLSMMGSRSSVMFLIETDSRTRILLRLGPGIHYRLRGAINDARVGKHGENHHSRTLKEAGIHPSR